MIVSDLAASPQPTKMLLICKFLFVNFEVFVV